MSKQLYIFLSRPSTQNLPKLGILNEYLAQLLSRDIHAYRQNLHQAKLKEEEDAVASVMQAMNSGFVRPRKGCVLKKKEKESIKRKQEMIESLKQKPHKQPRSVEFFEALKRNQVLKCLSMIQHNGALVHDCDDSRRTPLHWACMLDLTNIIQILVDFDSNLNAKDDYSRKPLDETLAYAQTRNQQPNQVVLDFYDQFAHGKLKRNKKKYDESVYVKYLTPVEQVKELADFIARVNDMSTLT